LQAQPEKKINKGLPQSHSSFGDPQGESFRQKGCFCLWQKRPSFFLITRTGEPGSFKKKIRPALQAPPF